MRKACGQAWRWACSSPAVRVRPRALPCGNLSGNCVKCAVVVARVKAEGEKTGERTAAVDERAERWLYKP